MSATESDEESAERSLQPKGRTWEVHWKDGGVHYESSIAQLGTCPQPPRRATRSVLGECVNSCWTHALFQWTSSVLPFMRSRASGQKTPNCPQSLETRGCSAITQPGADRDKIFPMRTAAEDREATKLMREYDRIVQRLAELGLDIVKLRAVDKR